MARRRGGPATPLTMMSLAKHLESKVSTWADNGWDGVTSTTAALLKYWFNRDPDAKERFYDCQRRAIETVIYCHEIEKATSPLHLYNLEIPELVDKFDTIQRELASADYAKYAVKMATGTGKTWVLAALLVWQYFNKRQDPSSKLFSQHFLVVTPGLVVLDRLLDSFLGKLDSTSGNRDPLTSDYRRELFVPPAWRNAFHVEVLTKDDIRPNTSPPSGPFVLITNWHQLAPSSAEPNLWDSMTGEVSGDSERAETFLGYLTDYPDLVVFNDEAHHIHRIKKLKGGGEAIEDVVIWGQAVESLKNRLHERHGDASGLFMEVDFSATPFYGSGETKQYFPHVVYDYDLLHAMKDRLVKQMFIEEHQEIAGMGGKFTAEREKAESGRRGKVIDLSSDQKLLLQIGLRKLEQLREEFAKKQIGKKPVLFILSEENEVADLVERWLQNPPEFAGVSYRERVLTIHSKRKEDVSEEDWERIRRDVFGIDRPWSENPKDILNSVLMLREGFDVKSICVVVVLRQAKSDILLEQIVGRGLRLMFTEPEYEPSKSQAIADIYSAHKPSNSLDILFVVEHPRFKEFYDHLRLEGYAIGGGKGLDVSAVGDLITVPALPQRIPAFDLGWPLQMYNPRVVPNLSSVDISKLPPFHIGFEEMRKRVGSITISERFAATDEVLGQWKLDTGIFDYAYFLQAVATGLSTDEKNPTLSGKKAEIMGLVDNYVTGRLFGREVDWDLPENYRMLAFSHLFDFVVKTLRQAIGDAMSRVDFYAGPEATWKRVSDAPALLMRESNSVETRKAIYPRMAFAPRGGGFEREFMQRVLNTSIEVKAFVKLDRRHGFTIPYRSESGVLRDYEPDFVVRTEGTMYLIETKADKDLELPNVRVKAMASKSWCEAASLVKVPDSLGQAQTWEYLVISESMVRQRQSQPFEHLAIAGREKSEEITRFAQGKLF